MDPRDALMQAIRAAPQDDGPRLVYADWLMNQGDAHGDFITAQCARDEERARALWTEHGLSWRARLGLPREQLRFERGFVSRMTLRGEEDWERALSAGQPLEELVLEVPNRDMVPGRSLEALLAWLPGSPLRRLVLQGGALYKDESGHRRFSELVRRILQVDRPENLRALVISFPWDVDDLLPLLLQGSLRELALCVTLAPSPALAQVLRAHPELERLRLRVSDPATLSAALEASPALSHLELEGASSEGLEALARWPGLAKLQHFGLSTSPPEIGPLAHMLQQLDPQIPSLSLSSFWCTPEIAQAIGQLRGLRTLKLPSLRLQPRMLAQIARRGALAAVERLDLSYSPDSLARSTTIRSLGPMPSLRALSVVGTGLGTAAARELAPSLGGLRELALETDAPPRRLIELERLLPHLSSLERLHLHANYASITCLLESNLPAQLLELSIEPMDDPEITQLLARASFPRLRRFTWNGRLPPDERPALEQAPWWPALEHSP